MRIVRRGAKAIEYEREIDMDKCEFSYKQAYKLSDTTEITEDTLKIKNPYSGYRKVGAEEVTRLERESAFEEGKQACLKELGKI
jgi:hypothetical protein